MFPRKDSSVIQFFSCRVLVQEYFCPVGFLFDGVFLQVIFFSGDYVHHQFNVINVIPFSM